MNQETRKKLVKINQDFYRQVAKSFDNTRGAPWPGWLRLNDYVKKLARKRGVASVLDVGCGNGRWGKLLYQTFGETVYYTGVDSNPYLLNMAEAGLAKYGGKLIQADVVEGKWQGQVGKKVDMIGVFGVMHHVPGVEFRRKCLVETGKLLKPDGVMAVSLWQYDRLPGFEEKILPWHDVVEEYDIDRRQMDPGDTFLGWQNTTIARYCHFASDDEVDQLKNLPGLKLVSEYEADGRNDRLNRYLVYKK